MSKARNLADFISTGVGTGILADGAIATTEITGVTATSAEINKLAGLTASTAELNNVSAIATAAMPKSGGTFTGGINVSSGNVGIGTAPDQLLHLASSAPDLRIEDTDGGYADFNIDGGSIELRADQGNSVSSSSIKMFVDATERLRLDSAGNLGLGRSDPADGKFGDGSSAFVTTGNGTGVGSTHFATNSDDSSFIGMWSGHSGAEPALAVKNGKALTFGYWSALNGTGGFTERMRVNASGEISGTSFQENYAALSGTTPSIDADTGGYFSLTTSGNTTFTFAAVTTGRSVGFLLEITAGGGHTLTWPSSVDWAGGTAPDAPASGAKNLYVFTTRDSGTNWIGALASAAYA